MLALLPGPQSALSLVSNIRIEKVAKVLNFVRVHLGSDSMNS